MKLRIDENAISDLRRFASEGDFDTVPDEMIGDFDRNYSYNSRKGTKGKFRPGGWRGNAPKQKDALINWFSNVLRNEFDINANDANLERIEKPRTADTAKKSPDILIGISNSGNAMIIGRGQLWAYYGARVGHAHKYDDYSKMVTDPEPDYNMNHPRISYRQEFSWMDKWYKIVIPDSSDYMTKSEIRKANNRGGKNTMVNPGDYAFNMYDDASKYLPKSRRIFRDEIKLYNPDYAQSELKDRLRDKRRAREFTAAMEGLEAVNDRIRSIHFGNPIFDDSTWSQDQIAKLKRPYDRYVYYLKKVQDQVADTGKYDSYYMDYVRDYHKELDDVLTTVFGV